MECVRAMKGKQNSPAVDGFQAVSTILDSLDALVYVAAMDSHELLFMNEYGRSKWGEAGGRKCWQVLQADQSGPCTFCTNNQLLDEQGQPTGVLVWEFQNTVNGHWYQCRDQAIRWPDGRLVRIEIATDITDRKQMEQQLEAARREAEIRADTDALTDLNNRRAFFNLGRQVLRQAQSSATPVSLVMFDLDHFKQINDEYGHAAGDEVLKAMATAAAGQVRATDILARLGGEEFAILMPQTTLQQAEKLSERLCQALAACVISFEGKQLQCTGSFGVSTASSGEASLDALLAQADKAMFKAKGAGRNRVSIVDR
ncbi:diguanylate cyclase [Marinospirillum alkaliphilum DSM 21637]|uniref:diguanylate cyclase n=2 Tax=Marinospirillum TaxID=64968 RepID=A0A1K1WMX6_9GAMM|nr:diguanylate cyclase [Marinospirillum alkaliphilum DSM 21637]